MDQVLLTFGYLVMVYWSLNEDPIAHDTILDSLEMRWKKADQETFVASVLVNPFYRAEPFAASTFMNIAGICSLLTRVWKRLNNTSDPPPTEFAEHVSNFLQGRGYFIDLPTQIQGETAQAEKVTVTRALLFISCMILILFF